MRPEKSYEYNAPKNLGLASTVMLQCDKHEYCLESKNVKLETDNNHLKNRWKEENLLLRCAILATGSGVEDIRTLVTFMGMNEPNLKYVLDYVYAHIIDVTDNDLLDNLREEIEKEETENKESRSMIGVGITCSVDMGWQKRSSGHSCSSLSGVMLFIGARCRKPILLKVLLKMCALFYQLVSCKTETTKSRFRSFE